jgi:hypothetical protein
MKKVIVILLLLSIVFGTINVIAVDEKEDTKYINAVDFLTHLGVEKIFDKDNTLPITRGDFLYGLVKTAGLEKVGSFDEIKTPYADVLLGHPLAQVINSAYTFGLISGSGNFEAEREITYAEAAKMIVELLGYGPYANAKGGWPNGYLNAASDLGFKIGGQITYRDAAIIFCRVAETPVMSTASAGEMFTYKTDGPMLITKYRGIYKVKGIVTADRHTGITDISHATKRNEIVIDNKLVVAYDHNKDILGHLVTLYYEDNEFKNIDTHQAVYVRVDDETVKIMADDVEGFEKDKISAYNLFGKIISYPLSVGLTVIYNGKVWHDYAAESFIIDSGYLELIDNDKDGSYNIIKIWEHKFFYVADTDEALERLKGKHSNEFLDLSDNDIFYTVIDKNSNLTGSIELIPSNSMLAYTVSKDEMLYTFYMLSEKEGAVTAKSDDGIDIDYTFFKTTSYYKENFVNRAVIGKKYTFFVSIDGKIVGMRITLDTIYQYGYVTAVKKQGLFTKLRLFSQDNELLVLNAASTVNINNDKQPADKLIDIANMSSGPQLVKYRLDENGDVSHIITAVTAEEDAQKAFSENISDNNRLIKYFDETELRFKSSLQMFAPKFNVGEDTIIFVVPDSEDKFDNPAYYSIETADYFINDNYYKVSAYNLNNSGTAEVVVYRSGASSPLDLESQFGVVEKVTTTIHENGMRMQKIVIFNGKYYNVYINDDTFFQNGYNANMIGIGDVIRYKARDEIATAIIVDFDASEEKILGGTTLFAKQQYVYGKIYNIKDNYAYLSSKTSGYSTAWKDFDNYLIADRNFAIISKEKGTVLPASRKEIITYLEAGSKASNVLLKLKWYEVEFGFIYVD